MDSFSRSIRAGMDLPVCVRMNEFQPKGNGMNPFQSRNGWQNTETCLKNGRKRAFTLVEILTVATVIAILISLLLPSLRKARILANETTSAANLHTWGQVALLFARNHMGDFPATYGFGESSNTSYAQSILKQLQQQNQGISSKYGIGFFQCGETATLWPLALNNSSVTENSADYGADWLRFGTPYSTFLQYGGDGDIPTTDIWGDQMASAGNGMTVPYVDDWDPTELGVYQGLPNWRTGSIRLAPWMICPGVDYQQDLYAGDKIFQWGDFITTTYMYVADATSRQSGNFQQYGGGGLGNGIILGSGFNDNVTPVWGNHENRPASSTAGSPSNLLAADAVVWGGGGMQGNLYMINFPHYTNPESPAFQNLLYADGHVDGVSNPTYYDPKMNRNVNALTTANWAIAHVPPIAKGQTPPFTEPPSNSALNWVNTWNAIWTGWYFYYPNAPGGQ